MRVMLRFLIPPLLLIGVAVFVGARYLAPAGAQEPVGVTSPDGRNVLRLEVTEAGVSYTVDRDGRRVILPSRLGFEFQGAPPLAEGLEITEVARDSVDEIWEQPWGEVARVRDHHNELRVSLAEKGGLGRRMDLVFRLFDDGLGFRYRFPQQPGFSSFEITRELTEFRMADDARAWWIPANDSMRYEHLYSSSRVSSLSTVHTPLTMETQTGVHVVIHEAHLEDYAGMNLTGSGDRTLRVSLPTWADSVAVRGQTPFDTPWRTIQLADRATDLHPSVLGLNLNPPNVLEDTGWIRPMKYVGIWWGLQIGAMTWESGPKHGATTENTRHYIDFAAQNGFEGVLVEGWNESWDVGPDGDWRALADRFSFTQPYPDYDLEGLAAYARERGVTLIAHNETLMGVENYDRQLEDAFDLYERLGINAIKTGYWGDRTAEGHAHHGQYMVRHWRKVVETAARHGIMVNVHEPIKDTGERRTFPNMLTREGARGQEFNAGSEIAGNPPEHETILFFTRMMAGPIDFTPGIFDLLLTSAEDRSWAPEPARVRTTLAKQLALYVVLYSPVQMAADLPENYEGQPAFQFIRDVPVDWERTVVLEGKVGDYVVVARQERGGEDWYLGTITDEEARTFQVPLSFLPPGRSYVAEIYADGPGAHWLTDPFPVEITNEPVDSGTILRLTLAPGGGQAIRIRAER